MKNYGQIMYDEYDVFSGRCKVVRGAWKDKVYEHIDSRQMTFENKANDLAYKTKNLCAKITSQMEEMESLMEDL
jgi:hypothetical protein